MEKLGSFLDAGRRGNVVFRMKNGKLGMLTVWDYVADKRKITMSSEFTRQRIGRAPAVLALGKTPNDNRRLWTFVWITKNEFYDLRLEDTKTNQYDTSWQPKEIIQLAEKLTK